MTIQRAYIPQRDVDRTSFTPILRRLTAEVPGVHVVVFCDRDGEMIDYHSYLEPFDTKIAGALLGILLTILGADCPVHLGRGIRDVVIETEGHLLFVRPITSEYYLAGVLARDAVLGKLYAELEKAHVLLAAEAGL